MKNKKQINLACYTKSDLIWIINYMSRLGDDIYLKYAIAELDHKKTMDRINEADKYAAIASQKRTEYITLLTLYEGKSWNEVPHNIVTRCAKLMEEAQAADKKYLKLISIKE